MKRGTPRHPKVFDLMDAVGCDRPTALGYLELLWHLTADLAPQGDIGRFSDKRIEAALDWAGRGRQAGRLVKGLVEARWIDADAEVCEVVHPIKRGKREVEVSPSNGGGSEFVEVRRVDGKVRLLIHDWIDHCDDSVRRKLARANQGFLVLREKMTEKIPVTDGHVPSCQPENVGLARARKPEPQPQPMPKPEPQPGPEPQPEQGAGAAAPGSNGARAKPGATPWRRDEEYQSFMTEYSKTGGAFIDEDFLEAWQFAWKTLDFEQKAERLQALSDKLERGYFDNPQMVPRPRKFLEREWRRPIAKSKAEKQTDEWKH